MLKRISVDVHRTVSKWILGIGMWAFSICGLFGEGDDLLVPWGNQETLAYSIHEKTGGNRIGGAFFSITATEREAEPIWKIEIETLLDEPALTVVEVDRDSFLPVYSFYRSEQLGEIEVAYQGDDVSVERRLKSGVKQLRQHSSTYDLYQSCYLMRRFPIKEGYMKKVFITNSKNPIEQSAAVLRVAEIKNLKTSGGDRVKCYRVNAKIDDIRSSFWISADEKRLLYRIVDSSGVTLELIPPENQNNPTFSSEKYDYEFDIPSEWMGFVHEKRRGPNREQVLLMAPGLQGEVTITRHRKYGSCEAFVEGNKKWLEKHRKQFEVIDGSDASFAGGGSKGQWFSGSFWDGGREKRLFNAVVEVDESLLILTGIVEAEAYAQAEKPLKSIARSMRQQRD